MTNKGFAKTDGELLEVNWQDRLWIRIRRVDGCKEPGLASFDNQEIMGSDISRFLPNWPALPWTELEDSDLSHGQWYAYEGNYRINIYGEPGSSMWHFEVMDLWRRFMVESA